MQRAKALPQGAHITGGKTKAEVARKEADYNEVYRVLYRDVKMQEWKASATTRLRAKRKGLLCGEYSAWGESWEIRPWRDLGPNLEALNDELKRLDFILCSVASQ